MDLTIRISLSPDEARGGASMIAIGGPAPSIQPEMSIEGTQPVKITGSQANVPSPDASIIGPSLSLNAPMPTEAMIAKVSPEQMPPDMMVKESTPSPTVIVERELETPVPDIIPEVSSGKRSK
jgi:hypothetical protein